MPELIPINVADLDTFLGISPPFTKVGGFLEIPHLSPWLNLLSFLS